MTIAEFLGKFDLLAETPNGVACLRPLILHHAFHGMLTDRDADDEPAARLLDRSRVAMANQIAKGKAKREKPAAPVTKAEQTFALPEGWAWCRLVDTGQFINGLAFKPSDWGPTGRPIIRIQNLSGRNREYNRTTGEFDADVLVQDGDILVSWSATLDAFIWRGEEGVLNQHIFRVLPSPLVDKRFLYWLLKWVIRQLAESDHAHGLVMTHINRGPFLAHPIPLPPLAEQKRIVAKVDELMTLCDRLDAQQQEREHAHAALTHAALARFAGAPIPENLEYLFHPYYALAPSELRKSILALAVQGLLTDQRHGDGSVPDMLLEVQHARGLASIRVVTEKGVQQPLSFDIPSHWRWEPLETLLVDGPTNGISPKAVPYETPVRSLTLSATTSGIFKAEHSKYIDLDIPTDDDLWLKYGDILVQRGNTAEYVGVAAVYLGEPNQFVYPDLMMRVRLSPPLDPEYVHIAMSEERARDYLRARASGTTGTMPKINQATLKSLPIALPPVAEQRRIVSKVKGLMALVDRLEADLAAAHDTGERLMQAAVSELSQQV